MRAQPEIGAWYRLRGGESFEVVAIDEDDGTIEMQTFDGTVEEMEIEDWDTQRASGEIENAEAPEDWSGSVDVDRPDEASGSDTRSQERDLCASPLAGIDRFR